MRIIYVILIIGSDSVSKIKTKKFKKVKQNNKKKFYVIGCIIAIIVICFSCFLFFGESMKYGKFTKYIKNNERFKKEGDGVYRDTDFPQYEIYYDLKKKTYTRINDNENIVTKTVVNIPDKVVNLYMFFTEDYDDVDISNYTCNIQLDYSGEEVVSVNSENEACISLFNEYPWFERNLYFEIQLTLSHMIDDVKESDSGLYDNCKLCDEL
jgi:hypothetical protein